MKSGGIVFAGLVVLALLLASSGRRWKLVFALGHDEALRRRMVETQIQSRGVKDPRVLAALLAVPRHRFVPGASLEDAYADRPLPIGQSQTISQPYIVALMTELLEIKPGHRVLEVGTGSGYQAAVLSRMAREVYTIEIVPELSRRAGEILAELGCANVSVRTGDGYRGWPEKAPFDAVIVTAAPEHVPEPLLEQLKPGGRLVIPVGAPDDQSLLVFRKMARTLERRRVIPVRFVPMTGEAEKRD